MELLLFFSVLFKYLLYRSEKKILKSMCARISRSCVIDEECGRERKEISILKRESECK